MGTVSGLVHQNPAHLQHAVSHGTIDLVVIHEQHTLTAQGLCSPTGKRCFDDPRVVQREGSRLDGDSPEHSGSKPERAPLARFAVDPCRTSHQVGKLP
ncbi:hypothetical protein D3C71_1570210 [compost metagenome]